MDETTVSRWVSTFVRYTAAMDMSGLIFSIESEIATLKQVRALLAGQDGPVRSGRKAGKKRTMSASARARIAAAQKKRWAAWKRSQKSA